MQTYNSLLTALREGGYDKALAALYAPDGDADALSAARDRALRAAAGLGEQFTIPPEARSGLFSGPGRTELGGNHTDHQHGHVLTGSIDLDILACAALNGTDSIRVYSEGYGTVTVDLAHTDPLPEEKDSSAGLIRGVAAGVTEKGFKISQGFDAYLTSSVPAGSGVSSSAALEVLLGRVFNHFFCADALDSVTLAKIGQRAENAYFGKPCGLLDQMGAAIGGAVAIDFENPADPVVRPVGYDFSRSGHTLCIVDTGSSHADLTDDYAAIPREMGMVAAHFGKAVLREVPEAEFRAAIPALRQSCGDRAVLRAMHYYDDDRTAQAEAEALERGDFDGFLALVNRSGLSSALHLQNTWPTSDPRQQAIPMSLAFAAELLDGRGACRVHGGGFAGTIQAFVPNDLLPAFREGMEGLLGAGKCHALRIRPQGGCVILP